MEQTTSATSADGALEVALARLASLPLVELLRFPPDAPVLPADHADWRRRSRELLNRWDHEQWRVSDIDFTNDRDSWDPIDIGNRTDLTRLFALFLIGDAVVTTDLAPLLYAAGVEDEERLLLAGQTGDESRHTMFFRRFFQEVVGLNCNLGELIETMRPEAGEGFCQTFDYLSASVRAVHKHPDSLEHWVAAVTVYHIIIEGYLAFGRQLRLLKLLNGNNLMPAFTVGFTNVTRDEVRHTRIGELLLERRVRQNPEIARVIGREVLVVGQLLDHHRSGPLSRSESRQSRKLAHQSLQKRLAAIGFSEVAIAFLDGHYR